MSKTTTPHCRDCGAQIQSTRIICRKCSKKVSQAGMCAMCGLKPKAAKLNVLREPQGTFYEYCSGCIEIRSKRIQAFADWQDERMTQPERVSKPKRKLVRQERPGTELPWD